jgi:hypothetical protein
MNSQICKNCSSDFIGNFCSHCGQRSIANKRLQIREVLQDFLDNTFNIHRGLFFTFYNLIIRPGKVGHTYLEGQRKTYTNPTRYMVIALAFQTFIDYWFETTEVIKNDKYFNFSFLSEQINESMEIWNVKLAVEYLLFTNLFQIVVIPALFYVLFKFLNFNYTELLTVSFYFNPTILFINMPILLITKVVFGIYISKEIIILIFLAYLIWSNLSFFKVVPFWNRLLRILTAIGIFMFLRVFLLPYVLSLILPIT